MEAAIQKPLSPEPFPGNEPSWHPRQPFSLSNQSITLPKSRKNFRNLKGGKHSGGTITRYPVAGPHPGEERNEMKLIRSTGRYLHSGGDSPAIFDWI